MGVPAARQAAEASESPTAPASATLLTTGTTALDSTPQLLYRQGQSFQGRTPGWAWRRP